MGKNMKYIWQGRLKIMFTKNRIKEGLGIFI